MNLIAEKFGFDWPMDEAIKEADDFMLQWEWSRLMLDKLLFPDLTTWTAKEAKKTFLSTFHHLQEAGKDYNL
jgi:hypothetical protein